MEMRASAAKLLCVELALQCTPVCKLICGKIYEYTYVVYVHRQCVCACACVCLFKIIYYILSSLSRAGLYLHMCRNI